MTVKEIDIRHAPSHNQVADVLTKPLSLQFFTRLRNKLGVCSLASLELRGDVRPYTFSPNHQHTKVMSRAQPSSYSSSTCAHELESNEHENAVALCTDVASIQGMKSRKDVLLGPPKKPDQRRESQHIDVVYGN